MRDLVSTREVDVGETIAKLNAIPARGATKPSPARKPIDEDDAAVTDESLGNLGRIDDLVIAKAG